MIKLNNLSHKKIHFQILRLILCIVLSSFIYGAMITPLKNDYLNYIHVLFEWEQEPDAVSYNLQASKNQSFNDLILDINQISISYIDIINFHWNETYFWRVRPIYISDEKGSWIDQSYFSIGNSILSNLEIENYNYQTVQNGLVIFSKEPAFKGTFVIDDYGREIWNTEISTLLNIDKYGQLLGIDNRRGLKFNFNQDVLWETPLGYEIDSHELKQMPNGNYMVMTKADKWTIIPKGDWDINFQLLGYKADGVTQEFWWVGQSIVEIDKNGNEVWIWNPFDHFSMDDYDIYDYSWWKPSLGSMTFYDWLHTNSFSFDEKENVLYVSHRNLSRITKINYPTGNIEWTIGLPENYHTGSENICTDLLFSFQHHIQLLDNGDLLFFDNGRQSEMLMGDPNPISRIRRIKVIDNSYCNTIWEYDLPSSLYGQSMGSVQLLENGNYLVYTTGDGSRPAENTIIEVTPNKDIVYKIKEVNPLSRWSRAFKIPSIHPSRFSIIADKFTISDSGEKNIKIVGNSVAFSLINDSGFDQPYKYIFSDLNNNNSKMFQDQEDEILLNSGEKKNLLFVLNSPNIASTNISLRIWPVYHDYNIKEYEFYLCGDCGCNMPCSDVCEDDFSYFSDFSININNLNNNENCFYNNDLEILRDVISINNLDYFSPLEIGSQTWNEGRLTSLSITYIQNEYQGKNSIINYLPDEIGKLTELRTLYLQNHDIYNLPDELTQLNNLVSLTLANNKLSHIPTAIGDLKKLIYLDLGFNQLASIPESIGELENLEYLYIFNNQLMDIPNSICNLNLNWDNISPTNSPYFASGGNKLCKSELIPDCIENSSNFNISLEQNDYTFLVNNYQDCENLSFSNKRFLSELKIHSSYPNPFNPLINIKYSISEITNIKIIVLDMKGNEIVKLFNGRQQTGLHTTTWNALDYASGIYFIKISSDISIVSTKLVLIK